MRAPFRPATWTTDRLLGPPGVPCGAALDSIRSCYSTQAQIDDGPPQTIHWWFTDAELPPGTRHRWGSLNWERPNYGAGPLGEIPEAQRRWRDGSKPAGACGEGPPPLKVACSDEPVSLTATADIRHSQGGFSLDLAWVPDDLWWEGTAEVNDPVFASFTLRVSCRPGSPPTTGFWVGTAYGTGTFTPDLDPDTEVFSVISDDSEGVSLSATFAYLFPGTEYPVVVSVDIPRG